MVDVARAIHNGGVTTLELTADAKRCSELIATVDKALADTDAVIGAGTVRDAATARNVIEAGAEFVLAPNLNEDVIEVCNRERVVAIPGVMVPTEADRAMAAGADVLKMFPATTVGPGHISALQEPLRNIPYSWLESTSQGSLNTSPSNSTSHQVTSTRRSAFPSSPNKR